MRDFDCLVRGDGFEPSLVDCVFCMCNMVLNAVRGIVSSGVSVEGSFNELSEYLEAIDFIGNAASSIAKILGRHVSSFMKDRRYSVRNPLTS